MFGYVYLVRNKINGKQYIGQKHSNEFDPTYFGSGVYLKRALQKYGHENFEHVKVLEWCETKDSLDRAERYWIDYYNAVESPEFYNLAKGGIGTTAGSRRSDTFKAKIAITTSKRVWSESSRNKIRQSILGRIWINNGIVERQVTKAEYIQLCSKGFVRGRLKLSDETRQKISKAHKGRSFMTEDRKKNQSERFSGSGNPFYGRTHSDSQKAIWREMRSKMVWVNKDGKNTTIHPEQVEEYLSNGWVRGMIKHKK